MNFSRKLILVAGAALLAACGDKVTVAPPTAVIPPVTKINTVDVAPLTATITKGQPISFTAAVNADAGVTYATAWTSSNSDIQTALGTDGIITATESGNLAATPGASVCAEATAGTQKVKGCATLVVQAASAVVPATVSIASITKGDFNTPVDPNNVNGQFDVRLNFNPGNQVVQRVELYVNNVLAGSQIFTAAQAAALRFAADEAIAAQATLPMVTFSVHSEAYRGQYATPLLYPTTFTGAANGSPAWFNGANAVQAKLYTGTGAATAITATVSQNLNFTNLNGFHGTMTVTGGYASANDVGGYTWRRGVVNVSAVPVIYQSGLTLRSAFVSLGGTGCDVGGPDSNTVAVAAGSIIPNPSVHVLTSDTPYEFRRQGGGMGAIRSASELDMSCDARYRRGGEIPTITGVTNEQSVSLGGSQNNNLLTVDGGFLNSPALSIQPDQNLIVRLDNLAPSGGSIKIVRDVTENQTNWVNTFYRYDAGYAPATDLGVSYLAAALERQFIAGYKNDATHKPLATQYLSTSPYAIGSTWAVGPCGQDGITCPNLGLPDSISNATYNIAAKTRDALGNEQYMGQSAGTETHILRTFGIDRRAPVILTSGSLFASQNRDTLTIDQGTGTGLAYVGVDSLSGFVARSNPLNLGKTSMDVSLVRLIPNTLGNDSRWLMSNLVSGLVFDPTISGTSKGVITNPFTLSTNGVNNQFLVAPTTPDYVLAIGPPIAVSMPGGSEMAFTSETPAGYYIAQAQVRDQAGNLSKVVTRSVYVNNLSEPQITGLNSMTGPYAGGAMVQFPASAQDAVRITDGRLGLVYPVLGLTGMGGGSQVYVPADVPIVPPFDADALTRAQVVVSTKFTDPKGGMPSTVPFTNAGFVRNMQGFTLPETPVADATLMSSGVIEDVNTCGVGAVNRRPTKVTARVYNGLIAPARLDKWDPLHWGPTPYAVTTTPVGLLGNIGASLTGVGTGLGTGVGAGGDGYSAEFVAPILTTQVEPGVCFGTPAPPSIYPNFDSVTVLISGPARSGGYSTRTVTYTAWGAGGDQAQNCQGGGACAAGTGRVPFAAPFDDHTQLKLLFNSGDANDFEWVQQRFTPHYVTNVVYPFPTLDNGKYRNYQWVFTVKRTWNPAGITSPTRVSVLGVNIKFDGLVTIPTQTITW